MRPLQQLRSSLSAVVAFAVVSTAPLPASAHDPGLSSAVIRLSPGAASASIVVASRDLAGLGDFDADGDRRLSDDEMRESRAELEELAGSALNLQVGSQRTAPSSVAVSAVEGGTELIIHLEYSLPDDPAQAAASIAINSPLIERLPHGHRQFARLVDQKGTVLSSKLFQRGGEPLTLGRR